MTATPACGDIIEKLKALKPEPYSVCQYEGDCACESERGIVKAGRTHAIDEIRLRDTPPTKETP